MVLSSVRTQQDIDLVGRALGEHFNTELVIVVGSQAVLIDWPEAPALMRTSDEIDAYPANFKEWEGLPVNEGMEASEEIAALFGALSPFSESHGFYIDGVDNSTAVLHRNWSRKAAFREIALDGQTVTIMGPSLHDLAVSKLMRLVEKDRLWLSSCHDVRPFDKDKLLRLVREITDKEAIISNISSFLKSLPDRKPHKVEPVAAPPRHYPGTHSVTTSSVGSLFVRVWDERYGMYHKIDNHLGPAAITTDGTFYALGGKKVTFEEWSKHPRVVAARAKQEETSRAIPSLIA